MRTVQPDTGAEILDRIQTPLQLGRALFGGIGVRAGDPGTVAPQVGLLVRGAGADGLTVAQRIVGIDAEMTGQSMETVFSAFPLWVELTKSNSAGVQLRRGIARKTSLKTPY